MINDNLLNEMQNALTQLPNPVRLVLFQKDIGCPACPDSLALVRAVKSQSPKIALEVYDQVMDRDKADQYGIQRAPAIVVQAGNGRFVRFYGLVEDVFLDVMLETILSASESRTWFPDNIRRTLAHLEKDVNIQIFVEADCTLCKPVAYTGIGLSFESDLVSTDIVIAADFPELIKKYSIKTLPKTVFGANLHMDGHVTESQFIEMIFEAEGLQTGPDRRCLVCGKSSGDTICTSCKARIQAEAVDHKRKGERLRVE